MTTPTADTGANQLRARFGSAMRLGEGCDLPGDLCIEIDDSAFLRIGDHVSIRRGTTIQVHRGATVSIGDNVSIGAGSTVTRSVPPNTISGGIPARPIRTFEGPPASADDRQILRFAWFGTSIMEHLEGYNEQMFLQAGLPAPGTKITVESWRNRGYVQRLQLALQAAWPHLGFVFDNHGEGGATSRDILGIVAEAAREGTPRMDVAFLGCGINDVWRGFQGRISEAVDPGEFETNYREMLRLLTSAARRVICIGETPFGWEPSIDVHAANTELQDYNTLAAKAAADAGAQFVDPFRAFTSTARQLTAGTPATRPETALWSDGIHLSELGDTLLFQIVERHLSDTGLIQALTRYDVRERTEALATNRHLFAAVRA